MSRDGDGEHISKKTVVYRIDGMDDVRVRRDVAYETSGAETLTFDIYYPPGAVEGARVPAVVFVGGYPDAGYEAKLGCKFKEMGATVSWARLTATTGLAAITYTNREPANDLNALLRYVRQNAAQLGIDAERTGLWAASGNVPLALSALMREGRARVKCAVLCYGFTLDIDGSTQVAEASKAWGFVNPCAGKSTADLPPDVPLFIVRAGRDQIPHLNETLDRFMSKALNCNLPLTFVNQPVAPHAFDLFEDTELTREIIGRMLAFMRFHLARR
ncbi:MAG TPA: alpha/beta hydrolase [Pyrinomonadaceae bacterium]|jgi:hypothetical protein